MNALLAHLRRHRPPGPAPAADGDLLTRYLVAGDEDAFAELILRHGPVVYAACRRLLPDPADADDAFQAVWLVLVRRAARLAGRPTVGPWLYQVAVWTARNLRRRNAHRIARRAPLADFAAPPNDAPLRLDLDAALLALPEKYRAPVVLCHLHGWSRRDAAAHLGCPEGTLSAHLSRALARLRKHLAGADPAALLAAAGAALPAGLASAAVRSAAAFHSASLSAAGVSPAVADLTRGVLRMFWVKKLAAAGLVLAAVVGTGLGIGYGPRAEAQPAPKAAPPADDLDARIKQLEAELTRLKREREAARQQKQLVEELDQLIRAKQEPQLVLLVGRPTWQGTDDLELIEFARGKQVGHVRCSNVEMLTRVLTRTRKDPAAPKRISVTAPSDLPYKRLAAALDAVKAAGFEHVDVRIDKLPPAGRTEKGNPPGYVIEPPDVLRVVVLIGSMGADGKPASRRVLYTVTGEQIVSPDGTIRLGSYGAVKVTGLTTDQAAAAVRELLVGHDALRDEGVKADDLSVTIDVTTYNSKKYYVITAGPSGEQVYAFPQNGSDTVRDALRNVGGPSAVPGKSNIWVVRRPLHPGGPEQILPVDWAGITREGVTATNYQLLPGDRVYIKAK